MEESRYLNPIRPQPIDGGSGTYYNGLHEFVDYLPGTSMRFWYTSDTEGFNEHWHDATEIITCERGNYEATIEIVKQLRLRDVGGIIIIDYIDMENKEDKAKILEILEENLKKDRSKTQVIGFTPLDLLEMTRKHMWSND